MHSPFDRKFEAVSDHPLVSVLMPYYSCPEYLVEAVRSIQDQTYDNWEIIVVDDCSPYTPADSVLSPSSHKRIRVVRHDRNLGIGATRNTAARLSSGELLFPVDGDDLLHPSYLEKTVKALQDADADAAYTDVQIFGKYSQVCTPVPDVASILAGGYPFNTFLYTRELFQAVGGYADMPIEDTDFWLSALELGKRFAYVPEPLYFYRKHDSSFTSTRGDRISVGYYELIRKHKTSFISNFDQIISLWEKDLPKPDRAPSPLEQEYQHLHKEFQNLLEQYEDLEKRHQINEQRLASVSLLGKQLAYCLGRRMGVF